MSGGGGVGDGVVMNLILLLTLTLSECIVLSPLSTALALTIKLHCRVVMDLALSNVYCYGIV